MESRRGVRFIDAVVARAIVFSINGVDARHFTLSSLTSSSNIWLGSKISRQRNYDVLPFVFSILSSETSKTCGSDRVDTRQCFDVLAPSFIRKSYHLIVNV